MTPAALSDLIAAMPLAALAIDGAERIVAPNRQARRLLGQAIEGRHFVTMLRQPALIDAIEGVLRDGTRREAPYLGNDGAQDTAFRVTCRAVPQMRLVLVCFSDITREEQAGQMRRDFVANVSHELRTPLTALMGFIETLRGPARNDAAARDRFLDIMEGEAGRMNRLVGDLLSLSRVEDDERVRPRTRIDLIETLTAVLRTLAPLAQEAKVTLDADLGTPPVWMTGDADQVMQVFTNLIENAIKYGGSGGRVTLDLVRTDRDPALRAPGVRVHVIDYGPGIDAVHLPRLTERFYRADSHRSRALGGTGLGLAIVKHIVNRHRGRLHVQSEPGQGARFTVVLPTDPGPDQTAS
ncbi:sensor histidine kinase [Sulfitobacter sabulilitoris]|uniref:histidine kinase n=1 Tax=Sulfitobacter sabulilitoris TaxID=2562655 RepID=A0A5S3PJP4_9RHOB|nr:ATP-binding protein [Sulfitobacter sabulilitoris]TMM54619.1 two-component sensor histidine kinase [Sulfitobacter sabulilitoris]